MISHLIYRICNEKPDNHEYIIKSKILEILAIPFKDIDFDKNLHMNISKSVL